MTEDGFPLFVLSLEDADTLQGDVVLFFGSSNCSGTPLIAEESNPFPQAFHLPSTGQTWISPSTGFALRSVGSVLPSTGICVTNSTPRDLAPALEVPETQSFVPPFEIVTRGDLPQ